MSKISKAMVLAAGFGKRLRPITDTTPKPLVKVDGRSMLDRTLDTLKKSDIDLAVLNIHYLGEQIADHCATRNDINIIISDERDEILETGGGVIKALPLLGNEPFLVVNSDTFWVDFGAANLDRLIGAFDADKMDVLLLVCKAGDATGHSGGSDFGLDQKNRLTRTTKDDPTGFIYAGAAIYAPHVFEDARSDAHSLNVYFDKAISNARLFGVVLEDGHWFTIGTPEGLSKAEEKLRALNTRPQSPR